MCGLSTRVRSRPRILEYPCAQNPPFAERCWQTARANVGMRKDWCLTRGSLLALLASAISFPESAFGEDDADVDVLNLKLFASPRPKSNDSMRAVVRQRGITFLRDYPVPRMPKAGSEEVLVRICAAAINPVDYKAPKAIIGEVVGLDFAGIVVAIADGKCKHGLKVGDEVYGMTSGSLAELSLVADGGRLALKPASLSFVDAAALPVAYLTGLQALRDYGGLQPGGRALIIGASGGTGLAGVQLARSLGATMVVGVSSAKNRDVVLRSGADVVLDYTKESLPAIFGNLPEEEKFDVVYDCASGSGAGENYQGDALQVLKKETGQYVPINGGVALWLRFFLHIQATNTHLFLTDSNRHDLNEISKFVEAVSSGKAIVEPIIAKKFPFTGEAVQEGFALLKSRRAVGKVVFDMAMDTI